MRIIAAGRAAVGSDIEASAKTMLPYLAVLILDVLTVALCAVVHARHPNLLGAG
jgi:hypothetical protein